MDRVFDTSYTVFVSVSDGKDDLGNPETDPQIDTTTEVTINRHHQQNLIGEQRR